MSFGITKFRTNHKHPNTSIAQILCWR